MLPDGDALPESSDFLIKRWFELMWTAPE